VERYEETNVLAQNDAFAVISTRQAICSFRDHPFAADVYNMKRDVMLHLDDLEPQNQFEQGFRLQSPLPKSRLGSRVVGKNEYFASSHVMLTNEAFHCFI
jgi:hypothetical protein